MTRHLERVVLLRTIIVLNIVLVLVAELVRTDAIPRLEAMRWLLPLLRTWSTGHLLPPPATAPTLTNWAVT